MTKAEQTRTLIIEKTAPLFNTKGYEGTSLSDLTNATGLTKGAIYGHFADKEEIADEAFKYAIRKVRDMMRQKLDTAKTNKDRLVALVDFFAKYVNNPPVPGGCPLLNTAIEADDHRVSMRRVVTKELMSTVDFIRSLLEKGIKEGEFQRNINPNELAYVFFCSIEGALMFARVERSDEPMKIIVNHCKKILDQISNHDATKKSGGHRPGRTHAPGKFRS
jgi:AcrR family transcriptional regulator